MTSTEWRLRLGDDGARYRDLANRALWIGAAVYAVVLLIGFFATRRLPLNSDTRNWLSLGYGAAALIVVSISLTIRSYNRRRARKAAANHLNLLEATDDVKIPDYALRSTAAFDEVMKRRGLNKDRYMRS